MRARDLIDRFGRDERAFYATEFVAPLVGRGGVRVRIAGIVCEFTVREAADGWHALKPVSPREAVIARPATRTEIREYLKLFPRARLVASIQYGGTWLGVPAGTPQKGIKLEGSVPIALPGNLEVFQTAVVRFDGSAFLLERTERMANAAYLQGELKKLKAAEDLRPGVTSVERTVYAAQLELERDRQMPWNERRLRRSLEHAGAEFDGYNEKNGTFIVSYRVDGRRHMSVVSKHDLTVVSAGICLAGEDRKFDLASLVGVLREGRDLGEDE